MALLTNSWTCDILAILIGLVTLFVLWIKWKFTFWERNGFETPKPIFFFGNSWELFLQKENFSNFTLNIYKYFKNKNLQHGAIYFLFMPLYCPIGNNEIKNVMQNDFEHFTDRGVRLDLSMSEILNENIFTLEGLKWKNLRTKLTSTFTSGKMKMMFEIVLGCSKQLTIELDKFAGIKPVEIKDILSRFTIDIIGTCAFGIECNSLKEPNCEFHKYGKTFFEDTVLQNIIAIFIFVAPKIANYISFTIALLKSEVSDFYINLAKKTVEFREANNIERKDFMQLLIELKNKGKIVDDENSSQDDSTNVFSMDELIAQAFIFFVAGFETSSTTMTFCLYELAVNPEIQEKLRQEINHVLERYDDKLTYDGMMEMTYMDQVVNETLRKYPPLPALNRICTKDYNIPGTNIVLKKGTKAIIPVMGVHYDEEYYPNPEIFDPDRFSTENKKSRPSYTFLPFGEGPRICVGLRFGLMQTKIGLSVLLKRYKFSVNSKTMLPLKMDPRSFILSTLGGMWLNISKIETN